MIKFLDKSSFFSPLQFGFRVGLSTEHALNTFCNHIFNAINEKKHTVGLFLDFQKAFDMVNHSILIQELKAAGFRSFILDWFESYLFNRKQIVKYRNVFSDYKNVSIGVPQGSVLGPTLFLIYLNSIFDLEISGKIVAFADDIAICYSSNSLQTIENYIENDFELLSNWFSAFNMILSIKTKGILFDVSKRKVANFVNVFYRVISKCFNNASQF